MDANLLKFSKNLRKLRKNRKFTLEKLAEKVGVSPNHLSKLESSGTYPSFKLISKLSSALNVKMQDLFNFDEIEDIDFIRKYLEEMIKKSDSKHLNMLYKINNSIIN